MKLSELVGGLPLQGDLGTDPEVFGVRHDSRRVEPGDLFVGWKGASHDGATFAPAAAKAGAVAAIADAPRPDGWPAGRPWLVAESPRGLLGELAATLLDHPDRALRLIGITGTNGKSTTVELVASMLDAAGTEAARIGTLGYRWRGEELLPPGRTTPEASDLFAIFAALRDRGARAAAMEVSSHALVQGRIGPATFEVVAFTNLTRDHLDFHGDYESYFEAKALLFERVREGGRRVVNLDDPWGAKLAARYPDALGYGDGAAVSVTRMELDRRGLRGEIATPAGAVAVESPLLGRYNVDNVLAAVAIGAALGLDRAAIAEGIARTRPLPGRMEPVDAGQEFLAVVDYAHTTAALEAAIRAFRELAGGKVVVVFGCGGDRDPGKREEMGKIAGSLADLPIVTSDNPRSEDPQTIVSAIEVGLRASGNAAYRIVPDRREAIRRGVAIGRAEGWGVLVAGKGHEQVQLVGEKRIPFSDRDEVEKALLAGGPKAEAGA